MLIGNINIENKLTTTYVFLIVGGPCAEHKGFPVADTIFTN